MRPPNLRVTEYKHSSTSPWMISGLRKDGKRHRLFFKSKTDAQQELRQIKVKLRREGEAALELRDELRSAAIEVANDLKPFGKTLRDAGTFYLRYLREAQKSVTVSELVTDFLAGQREKKRSVRHQQDLKERLSRFCEKFGSQPVRTVRSEELERWLHGLRLGPVSVNNFRARIASLFSYGLKRGYLDRNPFVAIERIKTLDGPPEILTVDQLSKLLENAGFRLVPALSIGAFAGLRTAELLRLEWKDVDIARGYINVAAAKSKTSRRRLIVMSANLRAWLAPYADYSGLVWPKGQNAFYASVQNAAKAAEFSKWPANGLRHSFASYHLAKHGDAPQLALDMGHTGPSMIFNHYREIVTPEEAERYWQIFPANQAENVVPMAKAS